MSIYTIVEAETTLNAIENTPRSELPWHAAYGKVKSNRDNFSKLVGENVERFGGTNKIYNSENISSFGAK